MSDSPRSGHFSQTRFSTPVSELDDHRNQKGTMPLPENHSRSRRGTAASVNPPEKLELHLGTVNDSLSRQGMTSRDFGECAIADDEPASPRERRSSQASPVARRSALRAPRDERVDRLASNSRASSRSSRSSSPPNSVDAFAGAAERRRGRSGTLNSKAPSDLDLNLQRTHSGTTKGRRPTFSDEQGPPEIVVSDAKSARSVPSVTSAPSSVEEDVCFPVPENQAKTFMIDYEELEEFCAENKTKTPIIHPTVGRRASVNSRTSKHSGSKLRIFPDLTGKRDSKEYKEKGNSDATIDVDDGGLNEKQAEILSNTEKAAVLQELPLNRFTFFSSDLNDTVHAAELGGLLMPGESFRDIFELSPEGGVWWMDMLNATEEEITAICKAFGVHPLTREDIVTQESREKVELFNRYYFVCFRSFAQMDKSSEDYLEPVNVYAVVFREGMLSFTFATNPHAANVRKRIGKLRDYLALSADWICYALIDDIVDCFAPVIREIEFETDAIEDQVFTARPEDSREILRFIGDCRKKVMTLLRLLGGKADVIKGFSKRCNERFDITPRGDVGLYLSDIQDHVVTMINNLAHFEKILSRSHSNYLAQIQVDSMSQNNTINAMLGKVTLLATILVPLNLICGLFGMNVHVPGEGSDSLAWFFGIVGVILCFVVVSTVVAKKMRLI